MTVRDWLQVLLTDAEDPIDDGTRILHECRHCGVAVDADADSCPAVGRARSLGTSSSSETVVSDGRRTPWSLPAVVPENGVNGPEYQPVDEMSGGEHRRFKEIRKSGTGDPVGHPLRRAENDGRDR